MAPNNNGRCDNCAKNMQYNEIQSNENGSACSSECLKALGSKKQRTNTYKIDKVCWNCGESNDLIIPKGVPIEEFLDKRNCDKCGCDMRLRN